MLTPYYFISFLLIYTWQPPDSTSVLQEAVILLIYIIDDNYISIHPEFNYFGSIDTRATHIDATKFNSKDDSVGIYINIMFHSHYFLLYILITSTLY